MPITRRLCSLVVLACVSCSANLDPGNVIITCASSKECPASFSCDAELGRCIEGATNRPVEPSVILQPVKPAGGPRYVDVVQVAFIADDRNMPSGDSVGVRFEFTTADDWHPATPADGEIDGITERVARGVFRWNALADATAGVGGLTVDAAGFVALHDGIRVRAKASDSTGLSSPTVTSDVFAIGNTLAIADLAPFAEASYAGLLAIQMTLTDAAADSVDLEVEFQTAGDPMWRRAAIDEPLITGAPTSQTGNAYLVAWRTSTPANADPAVPQGVGNVWAESVALRARAVDSPEGATLYAGPWSTSRIIQSVRNQTPPEISGLEVLRPNGMTGTGRFAVTYVLADAESDRVDIRAELSLDGISWVPVTEYPDPLSEGFLDLAASPRSTTSDGVRHVLYVDPAGIGLRNQVRRIRLSATDGFPLGAPLVTTVEATAGDIGTSAPFTLTSADLPGFPFDIAPGDLIGNSALDAAIAIEGSLYLYQGDGAGNLTFSTSRSAGGYAYAVRTGRFDADSKADIVTLDATGNQMRVYLSSASFTPVAYATGATPHGLALADIDADGRTDIVVASAGGNDLRVFRGDGAGGFVLATTIPLGGSAHGVAIADFDVDGRQDAAVAVGNNLALLYGNGGASLFDAPQTLVSGGTDARQVVAADFDADGLRDIVLGLVGDNAGVVFANEGTRTFRRAQTMVFSAISEATPAAGAADLNGDGRAELVMMGSADLYIVDGAAVIGELVAPTRYDISLDPSGVAIADFNGDTLPDVFVTCAEPDGEDQLVKLLSQTAAGYGSGGIGSNTSAPTVSYPSGLALGDIDGDGVDDLLVTDKPVIGTTLAQVAVARVGAKAGAATGTIENRRSLLVDAGLIATRAADMNNDGIVDIITTHTPSTGVGTLTVDRRSATGELSAMATFIVGNAPESIVIDDFNADGVRDIVVGNRLGSSATVVIGSIAAGTWSGSATNHALSMQPSDILTGDFDGDGARDFIGIGNSVIATRRGNGSGGFSAPANASVTGNLLRGVVADINDDGCDDVVLGAVGSIRSYLGTATAGAYNAGTITGGCTQLSFVARADRNGDGVFDFVGGYSVSGASGCLLSTSRGSVLGTGVLNGTPFNSTSLRGSAAADFNRDGIADYATVAIDPEQVAIDWPRDVNGTIRAGTTLNGIGAVVPSSARWASSNTAALGRTLTTTETTRLGALSTLKGYTPRHLVPFTAAEYVVGDIELQRVNAAAVTIGSATGDRLRPAAKLGALDPADTSAQLRVGLDLNANPARGVVFDLPILTGRAASAGGTIRVFIGSPEWRRASDTLDDPLRQTAGAREYLPRVPNGDGTYRDLIEQRSTWTEILRDSDGDLATGRGARFTVDTKNGVVHVLTDKLGFIQAYMDTR